MSPENAEKAILAARYKSRRVAAASLQHRWWRYVDINLYVVRPVEGSTLWQIVSDPDGSLRKQEEKFKSLVNAVRAEEKGPSRKSWRRVERMFTLNLDKKQPKEKPTKEESK